MGIETIKKTGKKIFEKYNDLSTSLDDYATQLWYCKCPMCQAVCPVLLETRREAHTPRNKILTIELVRRGLAEFDEAAVDQIYSCVMCGRNTAYCISKQPLNTCISAARANIVNMGKAPESVVQSDKLVRKFNNPFGRRHERRFDKLDLSGTKEKGADIMFWIGCTGAYLRPEIPTAMIKIFNLAGVNYTIMSEEWCCGMPEWEMGLRDTAKNLARHNGEAIKATGVKTVVISCTTCFHALKSRYEEWGEPLDAEVIHGTEYIERLLNEGNLVLRESLDKVVTYHDPCHLGRYEGIFDTPRNVLQKVPKLKLVEMYENREHSSCCGSGGGYRVTHPRTAIKIEERVINEALSVNAEVLATSCVFCKHAFYRPARSKGIELKDVTEIVVDALGPLRDRRD